MNRPPSRSIVALGVLALPLMVACGDNIVQPPPEPVPPQWSQLGGFPPDATIYGAWQVSDDYVVVVGPRGFIARWDGTQWTPVQCETARNLWAIAGMTGGEITAVGDYGTIVHFDGTRFVLVSGPTSEHLRGLWRSPSGEFVVSGDGGVIVRGSNVTWAVDQTPTRSPLFGVWGSADDDVFAVGVDGTIIHDDGTGWSEMTSGTTALLSSVSGTGPDDVYAAGTEGTILHYDGTSWSEMPTGTTDALQSISAPGDPFAVGANGAMLSLENGAWTRVDCGTDQWLYACTRVGSRAWAFGATSALSSDGGAWAARTRGLVPSLNAVTGPTSGPLVTVGDGGYIARGNRESWNLEEGGTSRSLHAAWEDADGNVFAVGVNRILRFDGSTWVTEFDQPVEFFDVNGGPSGTIAVGSPTAIYGRSGGTWLSMRLTTPLSAVLRAYASATADQAYIVGDGGTVIVYNGRAWMPVQSGFSENLYDVVPTAGTYKAIAVGDAGRIIALRTADNMWKAMESPTSVALRAMARGPGGNLFAVGGAGTVLRYDGSAWTVVPSPTPLELRSAWSRSGILFMAGGVGTDNVVLRYGRP